MNNTFCGSAPTRLIDKSINNALRIVTGCLRPTPTDNLFILSGIQPTELRCQKAIQSLARRAQEPKHLLHESYCLGHLQLKLRHLFVPTALELLNDPAQSGISEAR